MKKSLLKQCFFHAIHEERHSKDLWLLDNGCKYHMPCTQIFISNMDASSKSEITLNDGSQVKALGKGVVSMLTKKDHKKDIHDFYYVPNLKHNFISARTLMVHGYDVIFKGSHD
jgi:hypothetical protein